MNCCQCEGIEAKFDEKYVQKKLDAYYQDGPKATTRQLVAALLAEGIEGMTLLDIGGGVGDIQHALLPAGAEHATNVEASRAYLEACKRVAVQEGHAERIDHRPGNFVELAGEIPEADIVTLDRVICCYHDMPRLVGLSSQKAKRYYGVVYPIDTWWTRLWTALYYNFRYWLAGNPMRNFVFPTEEVEAEVRKNGLVRRFHRVIGAWQVVVFGRV